MIDYEKDIFLTFDLDWACDEVLNYTLDILNEEKVAATFFMTHDSELIGEMRTNPLIELGIHPNFNGSIENLGVQAEEIIQSIKKVVPEAVSVRSHSMAQSSLILDILRKHGITHDVNHFIPAHSDIEIRPFYHWNGILRVPYFWEDDVHCMIIKSGFKAKWDPGFYLRKTGLKVFDFHPIHVFLNTEDLQRYESCKTYMKQVDVLRKHCNKASIEGIGSFLIDLIHQAKNLDYEFKLIKNIAAY